MQYYNTDSKTTSYAASLAKTVGDVTTALNRLNNITGAGKTYSTGRMMKASATSPRKRGNSLLEQLASLFGGAQYDGNQSGAFTINFLSPGSDNIGMSRNQLLSETASALSRAMKRNL